LKGQALLELFPIFFSEAKKKEQSLFFSEAKKKEQSLFF
jgi:hypothetical protein